MTLFTNDAWVDIIILSSALTCPFILSCFLFYFIISKDKKLLLHQLITEQVQEAEVHVDTSTHNQTSRVLRDRVYTTDITHGYYRIYEEV
jgi:hypothetical protein